VTVLLLSPACVATGAEVNLNGVIGNKALVAVDGGKPRWISVGETSPEGVKLVNIRGESAVVEMDGKRETLTMGQSARLAGGGASAAVGVRSVVLTADSQGHFLTTATINGITVRVLIDTGASFVSVGGSEARRLGINYLAGQRSFTSTCLSRCDSAPSMNSRSRYRPTTSTAWCTSATRCRLSCLA
jgi:aspartyl protease family protein